MPARGSCARLCGTQPPRFPGRGSAEAWLSGRGKGCPSGMEGALRSSSALQGARALVLPVYRRRARLHPVRSVLRPWRVLGETEARGR